MSLERERSALRHRVAGIHRQVDQHAREVLPIDPHAPEIGARLHAQRDLFANRLAKQRLGVGNHRIRIHDLLLADRLTAERQEFCGHR